MRNVLVTGGSRGIGRAIAERLAAAGYRVVAISRRPAAVAGELHHRAFDLADTRGIAELVKGIQREFGPIYGLVNNAALGTAGMLAAMREPEIERLVRLNTLSPLILTKRVARTMMAAGGGGRIVNIASIVAATGFAGLAAYGATKASLIGLTRGLARELGPLGITVNAVAPGFIDTEMTAALPAGQRDQIVRRSALRRLAGAEDVAAAVAFLMSEDARAITGTVITVDAGGTA